MLRNAPNGLGFPVLRWSLMTSASINVRCSWHCGVVFLVMTSYKDLQSTTAMLGGAVFQTTSGVFHGVKGFLSHSHARRNQSAMSTAEDNA